MAADPAAAQSVLAEEPWRVVVDAEWGFGRLDPLPAVDEVDAFYESGYRDLLGRSRRGPDLTRLLRDDAESRRERAWLAATLHLDIADALASTLRPDAARTVLDVGCGTGDLVGALAAAGWSAEGTEPATQIAAVGQRAGLAIECTTATAYLDAFASSRRPRFGAVTLLNVLEHVPDPVELLRRVAGVLTRGGVLVLRVPNDFNPLQRAALELLGGTPWWIVAPDHINYFSHASVRALVERLGYEVVEQSADYPMELFLLSGYDYRNQPAVGAEVHGRRRAMEMALDAPTRRALGRAWALAGVGRNAFLVARWPG